MSGPLGSSKAGTIVVIGAGIIGITCALTLQDDIQRQRKEGKAPQRDYDVLIVADEWPHSAPGLPSNTSVNYASMWAGAHVRPIPADNPQLRREAAWLKATANKLQTQLDAQPWIGISRVRGREYLEAPPQAYKSQDKTSFEEESGLAGYRELGPHELPKDVKLGIEYETFCINSPLYCTNLLRQFLLNGGKTVQRRLVDELEAFSLADNVAIVVNASGIGFGDPSCFPTRGQTVLTNITNVQETITRQNSDGSWSFVIPRNFGGGTVIGGTKEPHNWSTEPLVSNRERLLAAASSCDPKIFSDEIEQGPTRKPLVMVDIVGRRPTRHGGMRIAVERRRASHENQREQPIVHAYGAGGRGYEMSWGIAEEVADLVRGTLKENGEGNMKARL